MTTEPSVPYGDGSDDRVHSKELADRLRGTGFGTVTPGQTPTARDIWAALGGVRGVIESLVPGLAFLTVFSFTGELIWSVAAPLVLALGFVVVRLITKSPIQPALVGVGGIAASAAVALSSGRPEDNFVLGLWVNAGGLTVMVVSLLIRRPLIGVVSGLLAQDPDWRVDRAKRRLASIATLLWVGLFSARLLVQVPLFVEGAVQALAIARLTMGVPLYALVLWLSWLLMRSVYRTERPLA